MICRHIFHAFRCLAASKCNNLLRVRGDLRGAAPRGVRQDRVASDDPQGHMAIIAILHLVSTLYPQTT